jgi:hypothetical protein
VFEILSDDDNFPKNDIDTVKWPYGESRMMESTPFVAFINEVVSHKWVFTVGVSA